MFLPNCDLETQKAVRSIGLGNFINLEFSTSIDSEMEIYIQQQHQRYWKDANLLIWAKKNIENQKSLNTELKELGVNSELFNGDNIIKLNGIKM